jgi:Rhs element Vgr protein
MAVSPIVADLETLSVAITVNGQPLADTYSLLSVDVEREINRIPYARACIADGSIADATYAASETETFLPGAQVTVSAGYGSQSGSLFSGVIVSQGIRLLPDGSTALVVTCIDKAAALTLVRDSAQYVQQKDSDIISSLIAEAGLTADVEATTYQHPQLLRQYASAWDFIVSRADANGMLVMVEDGTVRVRTPSFQPPALVVRLGEAIGELDAELDARRQLAGITSKAWSPSQQAVVTASGSEPTVNEQGNVTGSTLASAIATSTDALLTMSDAPQDVLQAWANAQLQRNRLARIHGSVAFPGHAAPLPGTTLELAGLGARFNGAAFITSVRHAIEAGRWITRVGYGLSPMAYTSARRDIEAPGAAGLVPPARGLQAAVVKQVHEDPDGQRRVLVTLPLVSNGDAGLWVRVLAPYASGNAGVCFLPEVGDEVLLGFLGDDPGAAVLLGSLHSSVNAAPFTPDQPNTTKGIVTRSQLKVTFDDEKKVLEMRTPGGHIVTLSDDAKSITIADSNGNSTVLDSSGITLKSPKDIVLTATGTVKVSATAGISLDSPADVKINGLNVNLSATAALSAQGNASAKLAASGMVTVQGSMVMIN